MGRLMRTIQGRLVSERGSVGVVVALVVFLVLGMLTMAWNTAELSKAKMRLQNAADSAALAHAIWQARGMNAVQNINDEMYQALELARILRIVGIAAESAGIAFDALAKVGGPFGWIAEFAATVAHFFGVVSECTGAWLSQKVCRLFLCGIQKFYIWFSNMMGQYNAQFFLEQNEADPWFRVDMSWVPVWGEMHPTLGLYSVGISWPISDAFLTLPLGDSKKAEVNQEPWKVDKCSLFEASVPPWKGIYEFFGAGKEWKITPQVSRRGDKEGIEVKTEKKDGKESKTVNDNGVLPSPTFWIAFKTGDHIQTMPLDGFWNPGDSSKHKGWMFALSCAQCITGDVVPHSKRIEEDKGSQRPAGFGTGATAKLVPVSTWFYKMGTNPKTQKAVGTLVDAVVYH